MNRILLSLSLLMFSSTTLATTLYVDDKLVVTLRTGKGNQYQILRSLESGSPLEVVEQDGEFVRVRTQSGLEGWMRAQYLTDQPIARDRLATAEQRLAAFEEERGKLKAQIGTIEGERNELRKTRQQLERENQRLQKELEQVQTIAAQPIQLSNENNQLRERTDKLDAENRALLATNERLQDESYRQWFLAGAGVLGSGMLLGLVLPKLRRRKAAGWIE